MRTVIYVKGVFIGGDCRCREILCLGFRALFPPAWDGDEGGRVSGGPIIYAPRANGCGLCIGTPVQVCALTDSESSEWYTYIGCLSPVET